MNRSIQKILQLEPFLHLFFWCVVLFFPYVKYLGHEGSYPMSIDHELMMLFFNMIPVYLAYFWFFPLQSKRKAIFFLAIIYASVAFAYNYLDGYYHPGDIHPASWQLILYTLVRYVTISTAFFALYSIKQLYKKQKEIESITSKQQQAELRVLKGQINPHFLFNTLNTIYASALDKEDKTPDLILKLSDNFRYILSEGQKDYVSLKKELRHLKDYISLQEERLSNKITVNWSEDIDDYELQIQPLLLISFVENAFKYSSVLLGEKHCITIKVSLKDNHFTFYCENPFDENTNGKIDSRWKESGIGIENTKKRLQLLHPTNHELSIEENDSKFKVKLTITL